MILRSALIVAALSAAVLAGCASAPQGAGAAVRNRRTGPTSLSDLAWLTEVRPSLTAAAPAETPATGPRGMPGEPGRLTGRAVPALAPLPESGIWRPQDPDKVKPPLPSDVKVVTVRRLPPVPGLDEILQEKQPPAPRP